MIELPTKQQFPVWKVILLNVMDMRNSELCIFANFDLFFIAIGVVSILFGDNPVIYN